MKNSLFILILLLIGSCTEKTSKTTAQVIAYYSGFKKSNYSQIREVIADSLTLTEGEYTMTFTPESFYEQFKWDSVFKPVYELVELENQDEQIVATVSVKSL